MQIPKTMPPDLLARVLEVGRLIETQDNRIDAAPLFVVQEKVRVYGFDPAYSDEVAWRNTENDYEEANPKKHAQLERARPTTLAKYNGPWERTYYKDEWKFVTAAFTEKGCQDYVDANVHRHRGELRIYAESSYRNPEFRAVREFLALLATAAAGE